MMVGYVVDDSFVQWNSADVQILYSVHINFWGCTAYFVQTRFQIILDNDNIILMQGVQVFSKWVFEKAQLYHQANFNRGCAQNITLSVYVRSLYRVKLRTKSMQYL